MCMAASLATLARPDLLNDESIFDQSSQAVLGSSGRDRDPHSARLELVSVSSTVHEADANCATTDADAALHEPLLNVRLRCQKKG